MTLEEGKKYRFIQKAGVMAAFFLISLGAYTLILDLHPAVWAVLALIACVLVVFSVKAAKLEVLSNIDMTLPVYEQVVAKRESRRRK
jgi:hypothetical protein